MTDTRPADPPALDIWFDFASNYSYLSVMRVEAAAAREGVALRWRPFLLGAIFEQFGWHTSPFVLQKEKGAYVWLDMRRQCEKHGLPWRQPSVFPRSALLAHRVALVGAQRPWIGDFCRRVMALNFVDDRDIGNTDAIASVLADMGLEPAVVLAEAGSDAAKAALRRQTEEARALGIFGAPTFFASGEMFWGNDRLEDALRRCSMDR